MKPQLFSGARGKITFKDSAGTDHVLAFVTDVSVSENAGLKPTFVVGSMNPVAIDPMSIDVTASIGRIIPMNLQTSSTALDQVTSIDLAFEEKINDILSKDSIEIQIEDKNTSKILVSVKYARFAGRSTSMSSGDTATERYNFVGILDAGRDGSGAVQEINYGLE